MNPTALKYLVSPVHRHPLDVETRPSGSHSPNGEIWEGDLVDRTAGDRFPIVEGIPLLQPLGQIPDYYHQVLDILFGANQKHLLAELSSITDFQEYRSAVENLIQDKLGKSGVWDAFRKYADRPPESRLEWFVQPPSPQSGQVVEISNHDIESGREVATAAYGEQWAAQLAEMVDKWAVHLPRYAHQVLEPSPETIVELGGGAGLGTDALLRRGLEDARLMSLDMDYACSKVMEGLARWYHVPAQVDPIVANFWFLPFRDSSIDLVCSHYGLDESREVPRIINEVSRVLVTGGRFVSVSRNDPTRRLMLWLGHLDFSPEELSELVAMSRLYPGPERLAHLAEQQGLKSIGLDQVSPGSSHDRTIFVLVKDKE